MVQGCINVVIIFTRVPSVMSVEISQAQWRSLTCSDDSVRQRSPSSLNAPAVVSAIMSSGSSASSLPPLPGLIPIRKSVVATPIEPIIASIKREPQAINADQTYLNHNNNNIIHHNNNNLRLNSKSFHNIVNLQYKSPQQCESGKGLREGSSCIGWSGTSAINRPADNESCSSLGSSSSSVCDGESATHFEEHLNDDEEGNHMHYNELANGGNYGNKIQSAAMNATHPTVHPPQNDKFVDALTMPRIQPPTTFASHDNISSVRDFGDDDDDNVALSRTQFVNVKIEPQCADVEPHLPSPVPPEIALNENTNATTTPKTTKKKISAVKLPKSEPPSTFEEPPRRQCRAAAQLCQINNLTLLSRDFYESDRQRKRRVAAANARAIKTSTNTSVARPRGRPRNQPQPITLKLEPNDTSNAHLIALAKPLVEPTECIKSTVKSIPKSQIKSQTQAKVLTTPSAIIRGRKKNTKSSDSTYTPSIQTPSFNGPPKIRARRNSIPSFQAVRFAATRIEATINTKPPGAAASTLQETNLDRGGPRIKPIFLFVKQEETKIVEVRCEDYDKRNRIRLTKTPNGWRATPRTEHTLSNVSTLILPKVFVTKQEQIDTMEEERPQQLPATDEPSMVEEQSDNTSHIVLRLNPFSKIAVANHTIKNGHNRSKKKKLKHKKNKKNKNKDKRRKEKSLVMTYKRVLFAPLIPPTDHEPAISNTIAHSDDDNAVINQSAASVLTQSPKPDDDIAIATEHTVHVGISAHCDDTAPSRTLPAVDNHLPANQNRLLLTSPTQHRLPCVESDQKENGENSNQPPTHPDNSHPPMPPQPTPIRFASPERSRCVAATEYTLTHSEMHCVELEMKDSENKCPDDKFSENEVIPENIIDQSRQVYDTSRHSLLDLSHLEHNHHHHHIHNHQDNSLQRLEYIPAGSASPAVVVYEPYDTSKSACNIYEVAAVEVDSHLHPDNTNNQPSHHNNNHNHNRHIDCDNQQQIVEISDDDQQNSHHHHFSDTAHDLDEYHDLIEGLPQISSNHSTTEDILDHCENTMTGTELLDSLVKRGCEDNHISGGDDVKHSICLSDDYNDDDDILLDSQPVADIISRLGNSLDSSPKCLSFNEAGEIEGLHESLFETNQTDLSSQLNPYNHRSALEELSITLKDLEKSSSEHEQHQQREKQPVESTIVTPADSCLEDLPKDLSFKKNNVVVMHHLLRSMSPRPISRDSDAIQSPQPSGLPAVPPSPDILIHKQVGEKISLNKSLFLDLLSTKPLNSSVLNKQSKQMFVDLTSPQPQPHQKETNTSTNIVSNHIPGESIAQQQKEPLDLGKHRKSASPTVSCSEEAKRKQSPSCLETNQSNAKRIKSESSKYSETRMLNQSNTSKTSQLVELLASGKDPDPLTQLRLLISNPEWKLPDPILVPKDRLNAVLASPAREIPLLLTTRPELRLPEAFAFPSILQDPDILVISFSQLESILQKQQENIKAMSKPFRNDRTDKKSTSTNKPSDKIYESPKTPCEKTIPIKPITPSPSATLNTVLPMASLLGSNAAANMGGDIDAATMAAFNQMLWLPYLGQMGQLNPDMFKAMSGITANQAGNVPLQYAAAAAAVAANQNRFANSFSGVNTMNYNNPLEYAMWQDALAQANNAQLQRMMKLNTDREKKAALTVTKVHQQQQQNLQPQNQRPMQHNSNAYNQAQDLLNQQKPNLQNSQTQKVNNMTAAASFFPSIPAAASATSNRYYNNSVQRSQTQHQPQELQHTMQNEAEAQYGTSSNYRNQMISSGTPEHGSRLNQHFMPSSTSKSNHSFNHSMTATNPFFSPGLSHLQHEYGAQSSRSSGSAKARKEHQQQQQHLQHQQQQQYLLHQQQLQQQHQMHQHQQYQHQMQHQLDTKPRVTCKSINNLLQPDLVGSPKSSRGNLDTTAKLSNLMAMPSFDLTSTPVSTTSSNSIHSGYSASPFSMAANVAPKLKVKPGAHLLDPMAMQRRIFGEEVSEVGSTTCSVTEEQQHLMMPNAAAMYHPYLNTQKNNLASPWQWTTVTASGE